MNLATNHNNGAPDRPMWTPSARRVAQAAMTRFLGGHTNYEALYRWSVERPEEFWPAVWRFCGVRASRRWDQVLVPDKSVRRAQWFAGARLNFAENLLHPNDHATAIIALNEAGHRRELSHFELYTAVSRMARAMRAMGIRPGDRIAAYLPNIPEAVIGMLAAASIGAIWSSCSPDFGVQGVLDRFQQIEPRLLIGASGVRYNGKPIETLPRLREIVAGLPTVKQTIVVPLEDRKPDLSGLRRPLRWDDAIAFHTGCIPIDFEQLPFDHPLYILYSSGTTGLPKCMVHGAGGTLLQHLKELVLHSDVTPFDRMFYHTTCGWMMWNWMVSTLATGAAILLYDGAPLCPQPEALWDILAQEEVTLFGTSAKYLSLVEKLGLEPAKTHRLSRLKTILSTGSPLLPESFDYVYSKVKADVQLSSISGGTDIVSCFGLGNPIAPVWRGELQTPGLGMKVEIFNEEGQPVVGEMGELVCHPPFPSMPVAFWNDPDGKRYRDSYFRKYKGVWRHGDWAMLTEHGGLIITGRSDTTLNPGGVRIGTAEIYRQVEQIQEVLESLVIGQCWEGDVRIVLFVRLQPDCTLTPDLEQRIRTQIRENASPHHVPKRVCQVSDLPRTVSGKISETAVRDCLEGREVKNTNALANPECLLEYQLLRDSDPASLPQAGD